MITDSQKKQILRQEINELERQQYQTEIACKVLKKTEQTQMLEQKTTILIKLEEMISIYKKELEALDQ